MGPRNWQTLSGPNIPGMPWVRRGSARPRRRTSSRQEFPTVPSQASSCCASRPLRTDTRNPRAPDCSIYISLQTWFICVTTSARNRFGQMRSPEWGRETFRSRRLVSKSLCRGTPLTRDALA